MPVRSRITVLFTFLVMSILILVCSSVYYFSYTNRIEDIQSRLANRAITTARLLSQGNILNKDLIRKIDSSTSVAMKDKVVEAYDPTDKLIYQYKDNPNDTIATPETVLARARKGKQRIYYTRQKKDAIAYYYNDGTSSYVIISAGYDEAGNEKLRHLRMVLFLSFIGGIFISVVGGYFFSIRLLRPLKRIADEVNEISARNLTRRIRSDVDNSRDEWYYLSHTLNQLLNRLQESFEIQGRFIANASHELSTPLTSISSQLEVALQRVRSLEEYRQVIQSVYQDVRQLSKLTQTLLEFARASGTATGVAIDQVRIDEILLLLPGEMSKINPLHTVTLDFDRLPEAEEELLVFGNGELLFLAIRNIVSNACKYSEDHHADIRLVIEAKEIRIEVKDRGRGIPEEEWENIFQPFYRSENGHSIPGFGLGLSLSRRIIHLHKGTVTVESVLDKGSLFTIRLQQTKF